VNGNESEVLYFDLNDDGENDIQFVLNYWYSFWSPSYDEGFSSRLNTQHQYYLQNDMCNVVPLEVGDTIGTNLNWVDPSGSGTLMYKDGMGCNNFNSFKYIGLKLLLDDNYYFGWIRARTHYSLSGYEPGSYAWLRVSDYAINLEPSQGLIAGDTITSLFFSHTNSIISNDNLTIYPNPAKTQFVVRSSDFEVRDDMVIHIFNTRGLKVEEIKVPDGVESLQVDVSKYTNGLYYLQYIHSNQIMETVKFIKN